MVSKEIFEQPALDFKVIDISTPKCIILRAAQPSPNREAIRLVYGKTVGPEMWNMVADKLEELASIARENARRER